MRRDQFFRLHRIEERVHPVTGKKRRELVYIGRWYPADAALLHSVRRRALVFLAVSASATLTAGFLPAMAQRAPYVLTPFALSLAPLWFAFLGWWNLRSASARMNELHLRDGLQRFRLHAPLLAVLDGCWLAATIVYMSLGQQPLMTGDWLFLLCAAISTVSSFALWRCARRLPLPVPDDREHTDSA